MDDLVTGDDGRTRCGWCGTDPLYVGYHDVERVLAAPAAAGASVVTGDEVVHRCQPPPASRAS